MSNYKNKCKEHLRKWKKKEQTCTSKRTTKRETGCRKTHERDIKCRRYV